MRCLVGLVVLLALCLTGCSEATGASATGAVGGDGGSGGSGGAGGPGGVGGGFDGGHGGDDATGGTGGGGGADRLLSFSGYQWRVKSAEDFKVGPGPNYFSDGDEDVWVDASGLHLTTVQREATWYCTEVVLQESLGYGTYEFRLSSRVDSMDYRAVFGAFVYESESREIDIEFSRILANPQNAQYVVQPWYQQGNLSRFTVPARVVSNHRFVWSESSISFASWVGDETYPPSAGALIYQWDYQGPDIPPPGAERMRFNLWLFGGVAPDGGQGDEVVVESFSFQP